MITVNSQQLAVELRLLNRIVPAKPPIAILGYVRLRGDADGLHLYATDMEVRLTSDCQAHVDAACEVVLPAARLLALVEQFPDGDVSISANGNICCGAFKSKLQTLSASVFPELPVVEGTTHVLDGDAFRAMIAKVRYAVNATTSKYILKGALLTFSGSDASLVATDSKRLAWTTMARTGAEGSMVIPVKALDTMIDGETIEVTAGSRDLFFASAGRLLVSRTIDGKFPDYKRIIPQDNNLKITVDRQALTAALRRIVLVSEDNRATYLSLSEGKLELMSQSAEVGSASEEVAAEYSGRLLKVCVNGSYMIDFLEAASGTTVQLCLKDANSAMLLMDGADRHIGVVMLMKG